jgi:subtilisin family serine protease
MLRSLTASAVLTFLTLLAVDLSAVAAPSSAGRTGGKHLYIVQMREAPVANYKGEVRGLAATKPSKGRRLNKFDPNVTRYADYLRSKQDAVASTIGNFRKVYSYTYALNGFAAELTDEQAAKLRSNPNVLFVIKNKIVKMDTVTTPTFLGLDAPNGLWDQLGGPKDAGDGVVIGVIDSGIWPEHPSFASLGKGPIPTFSGICQAGEQFPATSCNDKVIGARYFNEGFGGDAEVKETFPYEFASPRAADGHGVHTASTAAGNYRVPAQVTAGSQTYKLGRISGMAPAARLAIYKACWGFGDDPAGGCAFVDTAAAIDAAVADGVDVINYSISGSSTSFIDSTEFGFLIAADAGVFVSASAGNDGPGASTVAHNSPWLMTVGAGTHDRIYKAFVKLANGAVYPGASLSNDGLQTNRAIVLSTDAILAGQDPAEAALCFPGTLDPAKVNGKIVVCDRGVNDRVEKSQVVSDAGGVGMILVNLTPNTLNADIHSVPTVHVNETNGAAIKAYVSGTSNPRGRLTGGSREWGVPAPEVVGFSSRGPALAGNGDLLKPDILAPGLDVLAAVSPVENGNDFDFLSGTSMAAPHIAGIAALVIQKHPDWSPAMVKSALMTTATPRNNKDNPILEERSTTPATAFGFGAGQVRPNNAVDPGLVYDAGTGDWLAFLCGTGQACLVPGLIQDPSDLNYPSIAIGALAGSQTVSRTVTNVSGRTSRYSVSVSAPAGIDVVVSPKSFLLAPGASKTYTVKFTTSTAALNTFALGSLTWTDGSHRVRSPIAIRPVALSAPAEVSGTGASGSASYSVGFGYSGPFTTAPRGLIPATLTPGSVVDDPGNDIGGALDSGVGITVIPVTIPAGTTYARFSLFDEEVDGTTDDLDLYVFNATTGAQVAGSGTSTSNEQANIVNPAAGDYLVVVHGFETDGPSANFTLFSWLLGSTAAGNMTVTSPATATLGASGTVTVNWSGLTTGVRYLGSVAYGGATGMPAPTIVSVGP